MAITTGIDIVRVRRIRTLIQKKKKAFLTRVFAPEEIAYCEAKVNKYEHYAARFAAKEAFLKACQHPARSFAYNEIVVMKTSAVPTIRIIPVAKKRFVRNKTVSLSIAHEKEYAVAVVVIAST